MGGGARIEAVLQFPVALYLTPEALGVERSVRVADRDGTVATPGLPPGAERFPDFPKTAYPRLQPPANACLPETQEWQRLRRHERMGEWGEPRQWPRLCSVLNAVSVWFPLGVNESGPTEALPIAERIRAELPEWVERLTTGLEVLSRQVLDPASITRLAAHHTEFWLVSPGNAAALLPPRVVSVTVTMPSGETAVTRDCWSEALSIASEARVPRLEHLLLRDARHALRRREYRRAVIDSGTAAEIALYEALSMHLERGIGLTAATAVLRRFRMLGNLVELGRSVGVPPGYRDLETQLVEPRNRAAHRGAPMSQEEALAALRAATELVDDLGSERFQALA